MIAAPPAFSPMLFRDSHDNALHPRLGLKRPGLTSPMPVGKYWKCKRRHSTTPKNERSQNN